MDISSNTKVLFPHPALQIQQHELDEYWPIVFDRSTSFTSCPPQCPLNQTPTPDLIATYISLVYDLLSAYKNQPEISHQVGSPRTSRPHHNILRNAQHIPILLIKVAYYMRVILQFYRNNIEIEPLIEFDSLLTLRFLIEDVISFCPEYTGTCLVLINDILSTPTVVKYYLLPHLNTRTNPLPRHDFNSTFSTMNPKFDELFTLLLKMRFVQLDIPNNFTNIHYFTACFEEIEYLLEKYIKVYQSELYITIYSLILDYIHADTSNLTDSAGLPVFTPITKKTSSLSHGQTYLATLLRLVLYVALHSTHFTTHISPSDTINTYFYKNDYLKQIIVVSLSFLMRFEKDLNTLSRDKKNPEIITYTHYYNELMTLWLGIFKLLVTIPQDHPNHSDAVNQLQVLLRTHFDEDKRVSIAQMMEINMSTQSTITPSIIQPLTSVFFNVLHFLNNMKVTLLAPHVVSIDHQKLTEMCSNNLNRDKKCPVSVFSPLFPATNSNSNPVTPRSFTSTQTTSLQKSIVTLMSDQSYTLLCSSSLVTSHNIGTTHAFFQPAHGYSPSLSWGLIIQQNPTNKKQLHYYVPRLIQTPIVIKSLPLPLQPNKIKIKQKVVISTRLDHPNTSTLPNDFIQLPQQPPSSSPMDTGITAPQEHSRNQTHNRVSRPITSKQERHAPTSPLISKLPQIVLPPHMQSELAKYDKIAAKLQHFSTTRTGTISEMSELQEQLLSATILFTSWIPELKRARGSEEHPLGVGRMRVE